MLFRSSKSRPFKRSFVNAQSADKHFTRSNHHRPEPSTGVISKSSSAGQNVRWINCFVLVEKSSGARAQRTTIASPVPVEEQRSQTPAAFEFLPEVSHSTRRTAQLQMGHVRPVQRGNI